MTMQKNIDKGKYWDIGLGLVQGCNWVSMGCDNCWSAAETHMRAHHPNPKIRARKEGLTDEDGHWNGKIRIMEDDLEKPMQRLIPTTYAIWNDLFHPKVPDQFLAKVIYVMSALCRHHTFLILTKRSYRMHDVLTRNPVFDLRHHPHIWIGVTVENSEYHYRIDELCEIPAAVRYVSLEPLLSNIDLTPYFDGLNWVIVGHESGPRRRRGNIEDVTSIVGQYKEAGVPVFIKQLEINGKLTRNMDDFPEDLRLRQFPRLGGMGSSATHVSNK